MEMELETETETEARIYCRLVYKIVRFIYTHTETQGVGFSSSPENQ